MIEKENKGNKGNKGNKEEEDPLALQRTFFPVKTPYGRMWLKIDGKTHPHSTENDLRIGDELKNAVVRCVETWDPNHQPTIQSMIQQIKKNLKDIPIFKLEYFEITFCECG